MHDNENQVRGSTTGHPYSRLSEKPTGVVKLHHDKVVLKIPWLLSRVGFYTAYKMWPVTKKQNQREKARKIEPKRGANDKYGVGGEKQREKAKGRRKFE